MAGFIRAAGIAAALLALAGCGNPPWTMAQSPDAIRLRWYPDVTPTVAADQVARLHCGQLGRRAVLADHEQAGSAETATWRCE